MFVELTTKPMIEPGGRRVLNGVLLVPENGSERKHAENIAKLWEDMQTVVRAEIEGERYGGILLAIECEGDPEDDDAEDDEYDDDYDDEYEAPARRAPPRRRGSLEIQFGRFRMKFGG